MPGKYPVLTNTALQQPGVCVVHNKPESYTGLLGLPNASSSDAAFSSLDQHTQQLITESFLLKPLH